MRPGLQIFTPGADELGDFVVLLGEGSHLVTELGCFASPLNFNLTRDRSELVDVAGANLFLNSQ